MSDSPNVLDHGYGAPYVSVFNSAGEAIIDPVSELPIGMLVTGFFYEFNEQDDDECEISVWCNNPDLVDLPDLAYQKYLQVQWGYITPEGTSISAPVRKVLIRDSKCSFLEEGVKVIIKCTDGFSLMKNIPSEYKEDQLFLTWVQENLANQLAFELVDYSVKSKVYKVE